MENSTLRAHMSVL